MKCTAKDARTTLAMNAFSSISTEDCVQRDVARKFEGKSTKVAEFFTKTRMIEGNVAVNHKLWKTSEGDPDLALFVMEDVQSVVSQSNALGLQNVVVSKALPGSIVPRVLKTDLFVSKEAFVGVVRKGEVEKEKGDSGSRSRITAKGVAPATENVTGNVVRSLDVTYADVSIL